MVDAIRLFVGAIPRLLRTRRRLLLENLALRQQLAVLKRKHARPRLAALDKLFWVLVRRFWSEWKQALIIVNSTWGAPRIHCELLMVGLDISERTISRWMKRAPGDPGPANRN
jgi:putative transposase